ncbi:hypothetical protein NW832_05025 [Synechococcus sp. R5-16]|uniref:hypothetical protein n=1 Tax=unclassified Synechococcus TaxID=2626047 RepID=UPI0039C1EAD3
MSTAVVEGQPNTVSAVAEPGTRISCLWAGEYVKDVKNRFQSACSNCHVGGATLSAPNISLSLKDLRGSTPPRDTLQALMKYQRDPGSYDGSDSSYGCRPVPPSWMDDEAVNYPAPTAKRYGASFQ